MIKWPFCNPGSITNPCIKHAGNNIFHAQYCPFLLDRTVGTTVNLPMRLAGLNVFRQFLLAKKVVFLDFDVIKYLKMRVLLEIQVLLEGESY